MGTPSTVKVGILTAPHIDFEQREQTFLLKQVRIGIGFHWDRFEDQEFAGTLEIIHNADGTETAVNHIPIEDYLCSVISSEMASSSPIELLKAHAVISRSWLMRAIGHTDHIGYDVCADDHCQRYEGLARINERAVTAVRATAGQVLTFQDEVCDCRYHKCCGGTTEFFSTCWEDTDYPYLQPVACPYCARVSAATLRQVLNNYDQETTDFHHWQVHYTHQQLDTIFAQKTKLDVGHILALNPLKRGASGRICQLQVVGEKQTVVLGKELAIRQALSPSCLYSSWFDILPASDGFTLLGHGWGHGVGLCQIGAAQMATEGHNYQDILALYYPNSQLKKILFN